MKVFDHVGIVTTEPQQGESWVEFSKVWVTNPRLHPQRIEYIRPFERPMIDPAQVGLWKYLQYTRLDTWFGQPTPWRPAGPA